MEEWLTFAIVKDGVLVLLSAYGAALSTFNWRRAALKEKRSIKLSVPTVMPTMGGHVGNCFWKVQATNVGHRSVTISTMALELLSGQRIYNLEGGGAFFDRDTSLPAALTDGQSAHVYISYADTGAALLQSGRSKKIKLRPVCEDTAGNVYRGDEFEVDPHELSRM